MTSYSEEFKAQIHKRMLAPEYATVPQLHIETGVNKNTLHTWRSQWKREGLLGENPSNEAHRQSLSTEEKFRVVIETATLNEADLSAYCREKGFYPEQVKQWQAACEKGVEQPNKAAEPAQKASILAKENKRLQKELKRKEKALAETAALLVLSKKCQAIWGDEGEE